MTEDELLNATLDLARLRGWLCHHVRPLRRADGSWRTAVQGDSGYPDLTMTRDPIAFAPGRLLFVELKSSRAPRELPADQQRWRDTLLEAGGCEVYVWRPSDWHSGWIEWVLR